MTRDNKQSTACPTCNTIAKRVFKPPMTLRMDSKVKKRIENGMKPRVVKKENMPKNPYKKQLSLGLGKQDTKKTPPVTCFESPREFLIYVLKYMLRYPNDSQNRYSIL
ncbi:hypothetical protein MST22_01545 [Virgibacillus halodenitrificans]|nr:hypothetical protein [Virgibacillus halodenitrificans]MCJ0929845.1 hypothetical protein [Virgibacillus halodenitrificans]